MMMLLLQTASRFVGGLAFAVMVTIVVAIVIGILPDEKERNASPHYRELRELNVRVVAWNWPSDVEVTTEKDNASMREWFWYAIAAAVLYGLHQLFTKLAADRIDDGLGGSSRLPRMSRGSCDRVHLQTNSDLIRRRVYHRRQTFSSHTQWLSFSVNSQSSAEVTLGNS